MGAGRLGIWLVIVLCAGGLAAAQVAAHNNPTFKEVHLLTLEVAKAPLGDGGAHSEPFALELPKKTVELVWRIVGEGAKDVRFKVAREGELVAEDLESGDTSTILEGEGYEIVEVEGAPGPFELEVLANVIDRSARTGA